MTRRPIAIVCGSRHLEPGPEYEAALVRELVRCDIETVIHGCQRGVDRWAGRVACAMGLRVEEFPANVKDYGWKVAFPIRNRSMALRATCGWCFPLPGGTGTADMTRQAYTFNIEIVPIRVKP